MDFNYKNTLVQILSKPGIVGLSQTLAWRIGVVPFVMWSIKFAFIIRVRLRGGKCFSIASGVFDMEVGDALLLFLLLLFALLLERI